jgi:N-acetylglucosaminyldiphosphoundecaprenol N-acetyl-beta-D-mannosaminyltransferase
MGNIEYLDGIPINPSKDEIFEMTNAWLTNRQHSRHIITLNAQMVIAAAKFSGFKEILKRADLVTVDGYGVDWALRKMGCSNVQRLTGVDLTRILLQKSCQSAYPVYFFGGTPRVAVELRKVLPLKWPGLVITGIQDGYGSCYTQTVVLKDIIRRQPFLLLVGLGTPVQELFLAEILPYLKATVGIGVGGAFEVLSGLRQEAPAFIRNHGWEWCFRMLQEPRKINRIPDLARFWYKYLR